MNQARLTTGSAYNNYDRIICNVEDWIGKKSPCVTGCESAQVRARIVQRVVEISNVEYVRKLAEHIDEPESSLPQALSSINANGIKINAETGAVSVSFRQWLRHIALFAVTWLHLLGAFFIAIFRRSPSSSSPATLLMEAGGGYEGCDSRFTQYCKQGPIIPLSSASRIIVRSKLTPNELTDSQFSYVSQPLAHLVSTCLQKKHIFLLLCQHLYAPILLLRTLLSSPASIVIARDVSYVPVVRWLDKYSLIESVVLTTSAFMSQPLWMKGLSNQRYKLHMVWYSQNFIPKMYVGEQESSNLPSARHMRVDEHWVWTEGFKSYLRNGIKQTCSEVHVVGPILWYFPEKIASLGSEIKVVIFDITPIPDGENAFGAIKNYYSVATMKKFVQDVVCSCTKIADEYGKDVSILLKHKRKVIAGTRDSGYFDFLSKLEEQYENFQIIEHQVNLYGLIDESDLSISVPYTSTVIVATTLKKPTIYYDPYGELIPQYEKNKLTYFASGNNELSALIRKILNEGSFLGVQAGAE